MKIVSAAPATPNPLFVELASKTLDKVKCALHAVNVLIGDTDLKNEFTELKVAIETFGKDQVLCVIIADRDFIILLK